MVWPREVAPFAVHVLGLGLDNDDVRKEAEDVYEQLSSAGIEVLFDDRDARAGEKFADADLVGIPLRVVVSQKTLQAGVFECVERATGTTRQMSLTELISALTHA